MARLMVLDRSRMVRLIALLTDRSPDEVEAAVQALSDDGRCPHCDGSRRPPDRRVHARRLDVDGLESRLTARESEVAGLVATGCTNAEIAAHLRISKRTVEKHVDNIRQKLGATSRAKLISWTLQSEQREDAYVRVE